MISARLSLDVTNEDIDSMRVVSFKNQFRVPETNLVQQKDKKNSHTLSIYNFMYYF